MSKHFNNLTPGEAERLAWLIEECSEVQKAATKILRHGYNSIDPMNPHHCGNRYDLYIELLDVMKAVALMCDKNDFDTIAKNDFIRQLQMKSKLKYMHHQEDISL